LSIIEQNAPQFLLKPERRAKKIIYLKIFQTNASGRAIDIVARLNCGCPHETACRSSRRRNGKKAFTISREFKRGGRKARLAAAWRRSAACLL
jgi:hypothetical protein